MIRSAGLMICLPSWVLAVPAAQADGQGRGDQPAILTHDDYPDLIARKEAVSTVAGSAVLAVEKTDGRSGQALGFDRSAARYFETVERLRRPPNHGEWREVAISAPMDGWASLPRSNGLRIIRAMVRLRVANNRADRWATGISIRIIRACGQHGRRLRRERPKGWETLFKKLARCYQQENRNLGRRRLRIVGQIF